jgi:molybdopterin-guanine dinucleotide biosynthesis adapter protein
VSAPVVSVVGNSGVGKTTFLEKLIAELKGRGYRVGAIKHDCHDFEIDYPGKDSYRLREAGADVTVIASATESARIERYESPPNLGALCELVGDVDIVLTEGYRAASHLKIEVSRRDLGSELVSPLGELIGMVTDQPFDLTVPQFSLDDSAGVADLLESVLELAQPKFVLARP